MTIAHKMRTITPDGICSQEGWQTDTYDFYRLKTPGVGGCMEPRAFNYNVRPDMPRVTRLCHTLCAICAVPLSHVHCCSCCRAVGSRDVRRRQLHGGRHMLLTQPQQQPVLQLCALDVLLRKRGLPQPKERHRLRLARPQRSDRHRRRPARLEVPRHQALLRAGALPPRAALPREQSTRSAAACSTPTRVRSHCQHIPPPPVAHSHTTICALHPPRAHCGRWPSRTRAGRSWSSRSGTAASGTAPRISRPSG